jgi:hypothetical protein
MFLGENDRIRGGVDWVSSADEPILRFLDGAGRSGDGGRVRNRGDGIGEGDLGLAVMGSTDDSVVSLGFWLGVLGVIAAGDLTAVVFETVGGLLTAHGSAGRKPVASGACGAIATFVKVVCSAFGATWTDDGWFGV